MGLVLFMYLTVAGVLLVCAYLIWSIVPSFIRRVVGLFSKGEEPRQSKQSNGQEDSSSDALRTENVEFEIGGDDRKPIEPHRNWLSRKYPELITVVLIGWFISGGLDYVNGPTDEDLRETIIAAEKTIGVLSCSVYRRGANDETANRITEGLVAMLKEVPELHVRNDFQFTSNSWGQLEAPGMRKRLKVNFMVYGQVSETGDRVMLSVAMYDLVNKRIINLRNSDLAGNHSEIPRILTSIRTSILESLQVETNSL